MPYLFHARVQVSTDSLVSAVSTELRALRMLTGAMRSILQWGWLSTHISRADSITNGREAAGVSPLSGWLVVSDTVVYRERRHQHIVCSGQYLCKYLCK